MKKITFLLIIFMLTGCRGQEQKESKPNTKNVTMIEKFDFNIYEKTNKGSDEFTLPNGNTIFSIGFIKDKKGFQYERLPSPSFLTIYKEYYANGNLKLKETYIGENVKVGISQYYDEKGNLIKEVNEDQKFGKIKPQQVLEFLQEKGYINLKTGEGRIDEDGNAVFNLYFGEQNKEKYWIISIVKGIPNTDPKNFPEFGEPPAFLPLNYVMDGETGKVKIDGAEDKEASGVYKTYEGKDYTREEWEEFEQKQFEDYARKHNISIAKNDKKDTNGFTSRFLLDN
ncbi:hypothetical protein O2K51_03360 [Apibacter raozihei]|uniref:hypothetical protein n=1 Tax=Apibacter raozihei TaxID=2500547 RepID=UPI000FE3C86A|nr:hypothetical protein [Apibacter raozihei]